MLLIQCWMFRGGSIRRYRTIYYLSYSFLCVAFLRARYLTCTVFPLALWHSHDRLLLVSFSLLCVVFLRDWRAHLFMLLFYRETYNSIFYADGHRHFDFLATCYLYSLGLFGEATSVDIGFDKYMYGRSSRNIWRSYSGKAHEYVTWVRNSASGTRREKLYYTCILAAWSSRVSKQATLTMNYHLSGNLI